MVSPVEIRQIAFDAAIEELGKNESNVVQDIVVHRVVERVIEAMMPYVCPEPPTLEEQLKGIDRIKRFFRE